MGDSQNLIKESRNSGLVGRRICERHVRLVQWAVFQVLPKASGELLADVSGFAKYFGIVAGVVERVIGYGILL
jgi:hypothetical protein